MHSTGHARDWFQKAIARARETRTRNRRAQMDSSASNCSVEARQLRHCEDLTSGRGESKRVMTALTRDSDTGPDSPRGTDRDNRYLRQIAPRLYHALDLNDGTTPLFSSRIARTRGNCRIASPRLLPARIPALKAPTLRGETISEETLTTMQQYLETITAATLAALNQHLASIGLLPPTATTPSDHYGSQPTTSRTSCSASGFHEDRAGPFELRPDVRPSSRFSQLKPPE